MAIGDDFLTINGFVNPAELERMVYNKLHDIGIHKEDYPIDPFKIIKDEGIILHEEKLKDENIRGMIVYGPNKTGILINANRSYASRRFIAMHELIHYWFHPKETQRVCFEEYKIVNKGIEWQANNAAAYALMPTKIVIELYDHFFGDIELMAEWLKVSTESLKYRINEIGLKPIENPFASKQISNRFDTYSDNDLRLLRLENNWLYGGI